MSSTQRREIKTRVAIVKKIDRNIVENIILKGQTITTKDVHELKKVNTQLMGSQPYAILMVPKYMTDVTKEARALSASKEFAQNTVAKAFVIESLGHRLIGNFYIKVNRPYIKTSLFNEREKALKWLKEQLQKHSV